MSHRETVLYEADEVEAGRLSIENCEYPEEVMDELGHSEFDQDGYIIRHEMNWNNINYNTQQTVKDEKNYNKEVCAVCFLLVIIFWIFFM